MALQFLDSLIAASTSNYAAGNISDNEEESDIEIDQNEIDSDIDNSDSDQSDANESDGDDVTDSWSDDLTSVVDKLENFNEIIGGIHNLPIDSSPIDYLKLLMNSTMIELLVTETNRYTEQRQTAKGKKDTQWKEVTNEDIYKFLYTDIMIRLK